MSNKKLLTILGFVFLLVGLVVLIIGIYGTQVSGRKYSGGEKVTAEITDIVVGTDGYRRGNSGSNITHEVYVSYTYQGRAYSEVQLGYYDQSMFVGKQIELQVNPNDPGDVAVPGANLVMLLITGSIGIVFVAVGGSLLFVALRRKRG